MGMNAEVAFFGVVFVVAIIAIVGHYLTKLVRILAEERTRREIAAYIAEGSMTPEQGERLLQAGRKKS